MLSSLSFVIYPSLSPYNDVSKYIYIYIYSCHMNKLALGGSHWHKYFLTRTRNNFICKITCTMVKCISQSYLFNLKPKIDHLSKTPRKYTICA